MKTQLHGSIIVTYRCNARCNMCEAWKYPTASHEEIAPEMLKKLPEMFFTNITGGEPFVRTDLPQIVDILRQKTGRIVISTNGFFTDRIVSLCQRYPDLGIRISIEGMQRANDAIRGIPDGFNRAMDTLFKLRKMGMRDIGFGMTVQDLNCHDVVPLYRLAETLGYEFATATLHNSHYFHKWDNRIERKEEVISECETLASLLLRSNRAKDWFRAYFNYGLINYLKGNRRLLPCEMARHGFFLDPYGNVLPCNGMDASEPMGNLKEQDWKDIWEGRRAGEVRRMVAECRKQCWMIGSAAPAIWRYPAGPVGWVIREKICSMLKEKPRHVRGTKIVVLGTRGFPDVQGGIETHCENLYPHLVKKGYQVVALGRMSYVGDDAFYHEGITVLPVRCPKHKFLETIIHSLKGVFIARKIKCDVLHIHAVGPALVTPLARLLGMKAVFTHHGADYRRAKWGRVARLMLRLGECLGVCFANEVIAISQAIADYLADTYKRRVTVIPNGVAPAHAAGTNSILTKHGLERGKYVLAVGRFVPEKGFDDLMDSFTEMINNNGFGDWKLVIAGDADHEDNYSARLKEKAAGDAHIVLTGFISGAPLTELYSHAGLFVQPSSHEGLPIALLEAMSYGLPCIASDIPAHAGTGLLEKSRLFKKGDAGALTALLEHALHNPLTEDEKIHQINTVAERFRWDRIADETARIYQRLTLS